MKIAVVGDIPLEDDDFLRWERDAFWLYRGESRIRDLNQYEEGFVLAAYLAGRKSLQAEPTSDVGEVAKLREALWTYKRVAAEAFDHWDADRDSKVGKTLRAMAGDLRGYRADLDAALATFVVDPSHARGPIQPPTAEEFRAWLVEQIEARVELWEQEREPESRCEAQAIVDLIRSVEIAGGKPLQPGVGAPMIVSCGVCQNIGKVNEAVCHYCDGQCDYAKQGTRERTEP